MNFYGVVQFQSLAIIVNINFVLKLFSQLFKRRASTSKKNKSADSHQLI